MTPPDTYVSTNLPRVHPDQALELMIHHLQLAACYFESASGDLLEMRAEVKRIIMDSVPKVKIWVDDGGNGTSKLVPTDYTPPSLIAGLVWLDRIDEVYKDMATDDRT